MRVLVIFDYKDITDPDSQEADDAIDALTDDIERANISCDEWWIEDAAESFDEEEEDNDE